MSIMGSMGTVPPDQGERFQLETKEEGAMQVREHMTTPPVTLQADSDYKSALRLMHDCMIHHLAVVDPHQRSQASLRNAICYSRLSTTLGHPSG